MESWNVGVRGAAWWELRCERDGENVVRAGEGQCGSGRMEGM